MVSLRFKFTLALLVTSLIVISTVGVIAHILVLSKFSQLSMEGAFEKYQADIAAYIGQYGSWDKAQQAESFGQFERRRRAMVGDAPRQPSPPVNATPSENSLFLPPPVLDEAGRPPFRFVLIDPQGVILQGAGTYTPGQQAPAEVIANARPIKLVDKTVALALPVGKANLSDIDRSYLGAIRGALMYALITACLLALLLGLIFSRWLMQPLKSLTKAIRSMQAGDIHQEVKVQTHDEIGTLLKNFNRMSKDLANAYDELEKSNLTIREQADHLKEISIHDELTGLYNRRYFNEQAEKLFAHANRHEHPIVFMIADIDHFKNINDRFTHATGDKVLQHVADILKNNIRKNDLLARYGGEEFVIAFPETPMEQAVNLCERLRELVSEHNWQEINPDLNVSISMGLDADSRLDNFEQMLAAADNKLYEAKNSGRNRICY